LVPSAVVKHDSLAEKLQFWQQDLPTPSSLLSELKEWQYFWKQYTPTLQLPGNLIECVKYADEDMYSNIRVLLIIGCTLPVSSAEAERSFSGLRPIKSYLRNRMSDEWLSGLALMHLHHDLDIDVDKICTAIFVTKHKRRMLQGCILYE